jgi:hypothetical protein
MDNQNDYIKITKIMTDEDLYNQISYLLDILYGTTMENVNFVNGDFTDLRPTNVRAIHNNTIVV